MLILDYCVLFLCCVCEWPLGAPCVEVCLMERYSSEGGEKKVYRRKKFNHAEKNTPNVGGLEKEVVDTRT